MSIEEAKMQGQIHDWAMAESDVNHMPVPGSNIPRVDPTKTDMKDFMEEMRKQILAEEAEKEAQRCYR